MVTFAVPGETSDPSPAPPPPMEQGPQAGPLPAFPGAEGFGAHTRGGQGGKICEVTTLEDVDAQDRLVEGSLREAVEKRGARIILFAVSGTIHLKRSLIISEPYVTIAGQSAPGDGICLADNKAVVSTHDAIIRHLRFRHGDTKPDEVPSLSLNDAQNIILDHCSISWSLRENLSLVRATTNATVQWCIVSEAFNPKYSGYGSLIAPSADSKISFHHNLHADNLGRNPRAASRGKVDFLLDYRNNVQFNWGTGWDWGAWAAGGKNEYLDINFIGNYSIAGLDTSILATLKRGHWPRFRKTTAGYRRTALSSGNYNTRIYQSDNKIDSNLNGKLDGVDTGWSMINGNCTKMDRAFRVSTEFSVQTESAEQAYFHVLADAGATPWHRDVVDARVIDGVRKETGRIIDSQNDVGGWPELRSVRPPLDSDGDGIPDAWEKSHGLDPNDPSDTTKVAGDGSGYTNIEVYLNDLPRTSAAAR